MLRNIFLFFSLFYSPLLFSQLKMTCSPVKVEYLLDAQLIQKNENFCFFESQNEKGRKSQMMVSANCQKLDCKFFKEKFKSIAMNELIHEVGSPGAHLCNYANGTYEVFSYEFINEKKEKVDSSKNLKKSRCVFKDKNFVNDELLFDHFKKNFLLH